MGYFTCHADILLRLLPPIVHIRKESDTEAMVSHWNASPRNRAFSSEKRARRAVRAEEREPHRLPRGLFDVRVPWNLLRSVAEKPGDTALTSMHVDSSYFVPGSGYSGLSSSTTDPACCCIGGTGTGRPVGLHGVAMSLGSYWVVGPFSTSSTTECIAAPRTVDRALRMSRIAVVKLANSGVAGGVFIGVWMTVDIFLRPRLDVICTARPARG